MTGSRRFLTWAAAWDFAAYLVETYHQHPSVHQVMLPVGPVWEVSWKR